MCSVQGAFMRSVGQCVGCAGVLMCSVLPCECGWTHDSQHSIHHWYGSHPLGAVVVLLWVLMIFMVNNSFEVYIGLI